PAEIQKLAEEREQARKTKDFKRADEIRAVIAEKGYVFEDTKQGLRIKKK
ncbi:MAG: cysteine--tRNA ligase, partial [Candidatus Omnitrophica bacterium]|nr:cysteine--tRNA ligase [Candidatus Omnitrophota bacterium]